MALKCYDLYKPIQQPLILCLLWSFLTFYQVKLHASFGSGQWVIKTGKKTVTSVEELAELIRCSCEPEARYLKCYSL